MDVVRKKEPSGKVLIEDIEPGQVFCFWDSPAHHFLKLADGSAVWLSDGGRVKPEVHLAKIPMRIVLGKFMEGE